MKYTAIKVAAAKPNRFITLTINPALYENPRAAYDETRRQIADFWKLIRKEVGPVEFFRVLELTKTGWPHYHFIVRSEYIPQHLIKRHWAALTGASIVDVRIIKQRDNVIGYMMKYLGKQHFIPWTNRRVSWSRNFFLPTDEPPHVKWRLIGKTRSSLHPALYIDLHLRGKTVTQITRTAYVIDADYDVTNGPVIPFGAGALPPQ
jgi:hypothetical protein